MNINPLRRSPIKRKPRKHRESWRSGKIRLNAKEMCELRQSVLARSEYRCENEFNGERCRAPLTWMMFEMHHMQSRGRGGSDTMENCIALCRACHRMHHDGKFRVKPHADWIP